ncbi:MAG: glycosyltransferase family A protein [Gemmatimonadaceae bacterium]
MARAIAPRASLSLSYSVVVPTYRAAALIGTALRSIAAQTVPPCEVIVVDDASGDDTETAVARHAAALRERGIDLDYVGLARNRGPSAARNAGLARARGTHIAFLDADDVWHPAKLEIVDRLLSHDDVAMAFHGYTEAGTFDEAACDLAAHRAEPVTRHRLLVRNPAQTSTVVIRRDPRFRFDEAMRYCEDYDLWLRILETEAATMLVGPALTRLGRPQLAAGGLSGNQRQMRLGEMRAYVRYCARRWFPRAALLPALLAYSALKHVRSASRRRRA